MRHDVWRNLTLKINLERAREDAKLWIGEGQHDKNFLSRQP